MDKSTILIEALDLSEAEFDSDTRVLRNVGLIRAGKSLNRRYYSEDVLQKAVPVFEGSKAFDSHAKGERRVSELTGWYENVRYENGVIKADRHFVPTRAGQDVMAVVEAIKGGAPRTLAGLSINAVGTGKVQKVDGEEVLHVESIMSANSVDDVLNPSAGGSYILTASNGDEMANQLINAMDFQQFCESRPDYIERLKKEWKTVRLDDATKQALAEADEKVKAATVEAEEAQQALTDAQSEVQKFSESNAKLAQTIIELRRELALERLLAKSQLPALYTEDLRKRLPKIAESEWTTVVETEQTKARRSEPPPKVPVTGAGYQESQPPPKIERIEETLAPLPDEDVNAWMERIERLKQMR